MARVPIIDVREETPYRKDHGDTFKDREGVAEEDDSKDREDRNHGSHEYTRHKGGRKKYDSGTT